MTTSSSSSSRPGEAPELRREAPETQEIFKRAAFRQKVYPDIKSKQDLESKRFSDLAGPLEKNQAHLPKIAEEFLNTLKQLKSKLGVVSIATYSYAEAKTNMKIKPYTDNLEGKAAIIKTANTGLADPNYNALFSATDEDDFNTKFNDPEIVPQQYQVDPVGSAGDPNFRARAKEVFVRMQEYRAKNATSLQLAALDELFLITSEDKFDNALESQEQLKKLTPKQKDFLRSAWEQYKKYREWIEKTLELDASIKKDKESILTKPIEYARSGEKYMAETVQNFRNNWKAMDGRERTIAGATILIGLAWMMNSKDEKVKEVTELLKKAGLLYVGYIAVNTTSKVLMRRSLSDVTRGYIDKKSGKLNFLKKSFGTDDDGANTMNCALVHLSNFDFESIATLYLNQKAKYSTAVYPETHKTLSIPGISKDEMTLRQQYLAFEILESKLASEGTNLETLVKEINKRKEAAKKRGETYVPPTFGIIITGILSKDILKNPLKKPKAHAETEESEVKLDETQKKRTATWWRDTGRPEDWTVQEYYNEGHQERPYPADKVKNSNISKISGLKMHIREPLKGVIKNENLGRYTSNFELLYNSQYKNRPDEKTHILADETANILYMTSKVDLDYTVLGGSRRNDTRILAVENAKKQALDILRKDTKYNLGTIDQSEIHNYVQPVFGVFLAPMEKKELGSPKKYVMFLRVALPKSKEYHLRKTNEWADGDMIQMMKDKPMLPGERLKRTEFIAISSPDTTKRLAGGWGEYKQSTQFGGAYEKFLVNIRINKDNKDLIDKALRNLSEKYAGYGITKAGFVRFLATHKFTDAEIKEALGLDNENKVWFDIGKDIRKATLETMALGGGLATTERKTDKFNKEFTETMLGFGNLVTLACSGDKKAHEELLKLVNYLNNTNAHLDYKNALLNIEGTAFSTQTTYLNKTKTGTLNELPIDEVTAFITYYKKVLAFALSPSGRGLKGKIKESVENYWKSSN